MNGIERLLSNPRITASRDGAPEADGACMVYWMQRAQRGVDNPALDVAIAAANELQRPIAVFFGLHPKYPNANPRHYAFLVEELEETKRKIEERGAAVSFNEPALSSPKLRVFHNLAAGFLKQILACK